MSFHSYNPTILSLTEPFTEEPPPYSQPMHDLPNNASGIDRPQVREVSISSNASLQPKILVSHPAPYDCCCILEDRFLLLGHCTQGIQVLDMHKSDSVPKTIIWVRAREMTVVGSSRIVLMRAGRTKCVRCYSLDALLRLCYGVMGIPWEERRVTSYNVPSDSAWKRLAALCGKMPRDERDEQGVPLEFQSPLNPTLSLNTSNGPKPRYVCGTTVLQDYFYKLPNSQDALRIQSYKGNTFVFVAVLHRDRVVLWRQRKQSDALWPFYRRQVYGIPRKPSSLSFADDRVALRYLLTVFSTEATAIGLQNGKVHTISVDTKLKTLYHTTSRRQQHEQSGRLPSISLTSPALQWTSLIQLPFYPDTLPPASLTTAYSIPPTYQTVVTTDPYASADPVALPSSDAPSLFLATFGLQSFIIDLSGALFSTQVYRWSQEPGHIEFVKLEKEWSIVGFGSTMVEIIHLGTAKVMHRLSQGPVHFLGRRVRGKVTRGLFWTNINAPSPSSPTLSGCGQQEEQLTHVYYFGTPIPGARSGHETSLDP